MTARKFMTEQWDPLPIEKSDSPASEPPSEKAFFSGIKFRHILVLTAIFLVPVGLIGWILSGNWGVPLVIVSLAGILLSLAALFVPVKIYQFNDKK